MQLTRMNNTCSMYELGGVSGEVMRDRFTRDLQDLITSTVGRQKNKAIIYNTNYTWKNNFSERMKLRSLGFKKIGGYTGNGGGSVSILMKKINRDS